MNWATASGESQVGQPQQTTLSRLHTKVTQVTGDRNQGLPLFGSGPQRCGGQEPITHGRPASPCILAGLSSLLPSVLWVAVPCGGGWGHLSFSQEAVALLPVRFIGETSWEESPANHTKGRTRTPKPDAQS